MDTLDQVLQSKEVVSRWNDTTVSIVENGNVLFKLLYNTDILIDVVGFIEDGEFTDKIKHYVVVDMNITEDMIIIDVKNNLQNAIRFLQDEADQLREFTTNKEAFENYIKNNVDTEDYIIGGYDIETYYENTTEHICDQVLNRRGYNKEFATRILDIIDAYFKGGKKCITTHIEAYCLLFVEALEYVVDILKKESEEEIK